MGFEPNMEKEIPSLQYLERYRNEGTRTYSKHSAYTEAGQKYRPDSSHAQFELDAFEVPREQMLVYSANPPKALKEKYLSQSHALFCIHPQFLVQHPDDPYIQKTLAISSGHKKIPVVPSSSTRTLFVEDPNTPHAVKVHFPFKISRYTRKMRDEVIEQAINVSQELENGIGQMDEDFAFLREVLGIVHKNLEPDSERGENWGYLVRDMIPYPRQEPEGVLVPGFALYGRDYFEPEAPLLLFDLIQDRDPVEYVVNSIMLPIIRHWLSCFLHFGFMLEPHGQNVLLELSKDGTVQRIVHRDLSVGIDMLRRREIRLPDNNLNDYNRTEHFAFHSLTYDRFMGGHFFNRLVETCQERYPGLQKEAFTRPCCEEFTRILPDFVDYFPESVWYFSEERNQFNKPFYQDTGAAPEWRPI